MTTTANIVFEDEMYYSHNDIAKLTDLPKDLVRQELEDRGVRYNLMLGKIRVYEGKDIKSVIESIIEQGSKKTSSDRVQYPLLKGDEDYNVSQITHELGISEHTFNTIYLGVNPLRYVKVIDGETYYKGRAINRITRNINEGTPPIKANKVEPGTYTKSEIISKLNLSVNAFNKIYVRTFDLKPVTLDEHRAYKGYIKYSGSEVNAITETILLHYGRVLP